MLNSGIPRLDKWGGGCIHIFLLTNYKMVVPLVLIVNLLLDIHTGSAKHVRGLSHKYANLPVCA